jgi:mRNA interferase RelE/StbE
LTKKWTVKITPTALRALSSVSDKRVRRVIARRIDGLQEDPERQGHALLGPLSGYRSLRAAGQRYRIVYSTHEDVVTVFVVFLGIRKEGDKKDVYKLAQKMIELGLLKPE